MMKAVVAKSPFLFPNPLRGKSFRGTTNTHFLPKGKYLTQSIHQALSRSSALNQSALTSARLCGLSYRHECYTVSRACCKLQVSADLLSSTSGTQTLSVNSYNTISLLHDVALKKLHFAFGRFSE